MTNRQKWLQEEELEWPDYGEIDSEWAVAAMTAVQEVLRSMETTAERPNVLVFPSQGKSFTSRDELETFLRGVYSATWNDHVPSTDSAPMFDDDADEAIEWVMAQLASALVRLCWGGTSDGKTVSDKSKHRLQQVWKMFSTWAIAQGMGGTHASDDVLQRFTDLRVQQGMKDSSALTLLRDLRRHVRYFGNAVPEAVATMAARPFSGNQNVTPTVDPISTPKALPAAMEDLLAAMRVALETDHRRHGDRMGTIRECLADYDAKAEEAAISAMLARIDPKQSAVSVVARESARRLLRALLLLPELTNIREAMVGLHREDMADLVQGNEGGRS